jgi:hypothetical protein
MTPKNKLYITILILLYALVNYLGYVFKFDFVDNYLTFVREKSDFKKNGNEVLFHFDVYKTKFNYFIFNLNVHVFLVCLVIQCKISFFLNGNSTLKLLLSTLVSIFFLLHIGQLLVLSEDNTMIWIGTNIMTRASHIYNFLLFFPSMPFLIFIFNKSLADKLKIISKQK